MTNNIGQYGYFGTTWYQNTVTQKYGISIGNNNFVISNNKDIGNLSGLLNNNSHSVTNSIVENN